MTEQNNILNAIVKMAEDNNKRVQVSTTLIEAKEDPRGGIVSFGVSKECAEGCGGQIVGLPTQYMAFVVFVDREELKKYR